MRRSGSGVAAIAFSTISRLLLALDDPAEYSMATGKRVVVFDKEIKL